MTRQELYNKLNTIADVAVISSLKHEVTREQIVIQYGGTTNSLNNPMCGWDNWDIILLVPSKSIILLDRLENNVRTSLKTIQGIEFILDGWGAEHYDDTLKAYYKTIRVRVPHEFTI